MKIVVSEVVFRVLQTNDWTNLATQLILKTPLLGLSSVKISAQSVLYLALHWAEQEEEEEEEEEEEDDEANMPPIWILKPLPVFQKRRGGASIYFIMPFSENTKTKLRFAHMECFHRPHFAPHPAFLAFYLAVKGKRREGEHGQAPKGKHVNYISHIFRCMLTPHRASP